MTARQGSKVIPELAGVPETLLWTLYQRASEAARPRSALRDPWAVELCRRIDYPFVQRFGRARGTVAQLIALGARGFDDVVRAFLDTSPGGTVVALGEGLETAFWRVDNGRVEWLSVDLPESLRLRQALLPAEGRRRVLACDARDPRWAAEAARSGAPVLVTAQGLLMYLKPDEVRDLIGLCARSFPGGGLVFDAVPPWFAAAARAGRLRTATGYRLPPMAWSMTAGQRSRLREPDPGVAEIHAIAFPPGHGLFWGHLAPAISVVPPLRDHVPSITLLRFAGRTPDPSSAGVG
jgi:O-methyltransferase involved in polyketide biosynthesis